MQRIRRADHRDVVNVRDEAGAIGLERVRDPHADFDRRFANARSRLVATCRALVGDDAEDVVQDTYLRASSRLGQLRDPASLEAWLAAMAINDCYGRHRRRQRLAELLSGVVPTSPAASDPDLRAMVEALPYRQRTVVVLHYGHGLTLEEIARLLTENPNTIRSVLFRARAKLRAQLSDEPGRGRREPSHVR